MSLKLDGRRETELRDEMLRRAEAVLGFSGEVVEPGKVETAILTVAARISEEVTRRLDKIPDKQADNFYSAVGIGRDPARPASLPVAFKLSDTAPDDLDAPAGTKLQASTGATQTVFETETGINLARGSIASLVAVDALKDAIYVAVPTVPEAQLPAATPPDRVLSAGAGAGATVLQISPGTGLAPGGAISIETAEGAVEYGVSKVDGDLVAIDPALAADAPENTKVRDVVQFGPFETGARIRQSHMLYLSHATLLDVPSEVTITVSGLDIQQEPPEWSWYGKLNEDDPEASWIEFESAEPSAGRWTLTKTQGKPEKTEVEGRPGLWIRAKLQESSMRSDRGQTIRLSVASGETCKKDHERRCDPAPKTVEYEAIAVTTPVVTNKPYYPFGREPRLFDSFYVGSKEAFGKAGAEISLCFELGGPALGQMAAVTDGRSVEVYGVGTDGLLWRAVISENAHQFSQVPGPVDSNAEGFPKQACVAAQLKDGKVRLAIGDSGSVHIAKFNYGSPLPEGAIEWTLLKDASGAPAEQVTAVFLSDDPSQTIHALAKDRILSWTGTGAAAEPIKAAVDLLSLQGTADALLITRDPGTPHWKIQRKRSGNDALEDVCTVSPDEFAKASRSAGISPSGALYIAGFDDEKLVITKVDAPSKIDVRPGLQLQPQPIAFDQVSEIKSGWPPALMIANPSAVAFIPKGERDYREAPIADIGLTPGGKRQFLTEGNWTVVQHADQGLLYRKSPGGRALGEKSFEGIPTAVIREPDVPTGAQFLAFEAEPSGPVFYLPSNPDGDRLIVPLTKEGIGDPGDAVFFNVQGITAETLTVDTNDDLSITGQTGTAGRDILLIQGTQADPILSAWHLTSTGTAGKWKKPANFPTGTTFSCAKLDALPLLPTIPVFEPYFWLKDISLPQALQNEGPVSSLYDPEVELTATSVERFTSPASVAFSAIPLEEDLLDGTFARFALEAEPWSSIGPNQPANPALSWEYWNGTSWWALDPDELGDHTANLQLNGGVFFTVPEDLEESDVGGRTSRWIRARLVGGDYGEARVIVKSEKVTDPQTNATVDQQTVTRDLSSIRAPYIVSLSVGYCAMRAVNPEIILTADNLGVIDQTSANDADLPVRIFPPVSTVVSATPPVAVPEPLDDCCERWPDPPPGVSDPPAVPAPTFTRAFLVPLDQQPVRGLLSLYFDVVPGGVAAEGLTAAVFRGGGFLEAKIKDGTSTLTEPGTITVTVEDPPDLMQLFGITAYWLRIAAEGNPDKWSPHVRGIYLNGVRATSVESRSLESIGTSTGAPDQTFLLPAPPVVAETLSLMVSEPIGIDEALARGGKEEISGMPGPWVPWRCVDTFPEGDGDEPNRLFMLDAETGTVSFGNGASALVPPIGSAILAYAYKHVTGLDANNVRAGAELQTVSPLAGVDKVIALDAAQGGTNVEPAALARMRASAKMRHQSRIVSLADLEDFVLARVASIAQVRAMNRDNGVRLVVVASGENPIPMPSALRAIEQAVGQVSTSRLRTPGTLHAVGPRIVEIEVELVFDPDPGADWVTLEDKAEKAVGQLLDHRNGGFERLGWPVGIVPSIADISAAVEALADRGTLCEVTIARKGSKPLPTPFPPDVLVRLSELKVEQARKAAA